MGADLYLNSVFKPNYEVWEERFNQAVDVRDDCDRQSPEWRQRQREAEECFERMRGRSYFRDPYNSSSVLWRFELSWWQDVIPLLDEHGRLSVEKARELLQLLESRQQIFAANVSRLPKHERQNCSARAGELRKFLESAIELNCPIGCRL